MRRAFCLGFLVWLAVSASACGESRKGGIAPDFTLPFLENPGKTLTLSEAVAQRPVLLVFWATWCPSCVEEIATLNEWAEKYSREDLRIIAVNVEESREHVRAFLEKHPIHYPVLLDEDGRMSGPYRLSGLPVSLFLAKGGEIIYYGFGLPSNMDQLVSSH